MNKIYKVIWNSQLRCWQAVSELAKNHSTSQSTVDHKNALTGTVQKVSRINLIRLAFWGLALLPLSIYAAISNTELPTGANITQGSANISQNGNVLNIHQNSQNLSTNWNTFNIGKDATVNFNQQNQSSIAINRVLDSNASQIMGRLNANGQVFLLNPNGVVFSKTAQVNVGGLVASTLSLNDADIQNGKYTLKANANSTATIENNGTIQTLLGGTVALIAPNVKNTGSIVTPNGVTHLTAASQVTLALQDGSLTQYQVDQGVFKGLVDNGGAILADNGAVYLTAKAKDSLSKAVVNHSGIIEANRLSQNAKGEIILLGDMQNGETNVSGLLKAEGKNGQDGGFIETSAAQVKIENSTVVSSHSEGGKIGNWLIDPTDFSINSGNASASSSGIGATTLASSLATSNVILLTSTTGNQKGDINVNADVTWGSANSLTLNAQNDININANITATNNSGKLNLIYGQNTANTSANYYINNGAKINLKAGQNFSTQKGTAATINYQVITALGAQGSTTSQDLQGINGNLSGNYVLGADIDASSTWQWNGYTGFDPIGFYNANLSPTDLSQQAFRGRFDGLGHAISGLSIESMYQGIGLFAITHQDTLIQNVGLNNISYSGYGKTGGIVGINLGTINNVYVNAGLVTGNTEQYGGLVGWNYNSGNILNSYANVTVKGKYSNNNYIGGLVGYSDGVVSSSFATGAVTGNNYVGGLIGGISGQINNSYATGTVIGSQYVGGLVGFNGGSVDKNYSSGSVTGNTFVGGLVGGGNGTTTNSFWNTSTSGRTNSAGGVGKTTTELQQISTFAGWDIDDAGGTGKVWRIYEGRSAPLLRHFLKPLVTEIVANFSGKTYDGSIASGTLASGLNYKTTSKNAGVYSLNDGSILITGVPIAANTTQFGDDVIYKENGGSGSLTIAKRDLNINGLSVADKVYDTSKVATLSGTAGVTALSGDSVTLSGTGSGLFADKNVGNNKNVIASGYTLTGTDALNYNLLQPTNLKASITPAVLTINGISVADKTYDGLFNATLNGTASVNPFAGDFVSLIGSGIGTFTDKNAGIRSVIVTGYNLTGADAGNYTFSQPIGLSATIHKAQAIVTANSLNTVYNGKDQTASGFSVSGLVNGETESVLTAVSASTTAKDAGSYTNKASGLDKNYNLSFIDGSLNIAKAKAIVTANSLNTVYNGKDQTAAGFSATGLVNGETTTVLSGVSATVTAKDAGHYTNTATGIDKNYELSFVDGSLDIAKAKATVTANSVSTTYNGKDQTAAGFSATGLVNGEDTSVLTGVTASVTGKDAGQYTNTATGIDKNYELSFVNGSLDIAKAKATVTANSVSTTYNGKDQTAAGFSATGLVNGEDTSVLSGVSASVTAKDAGKYNNTVTGVDKNYDLTLIDGSLDIAKAKATVTANSVSTTYNGKDQTATGFSAKGLVNGETITVLSGVSATVTGKDAGKYTNTVTGVDKNYDLTLIDGSLDIAKAKATVTANSVSTTYNGKDQTAAGFSATGLVNGETESVLSGVSATVTAKDAGQYTNTVTGVDKNYDLSFIDGSLDIAKAKATVTANSVSTTYNGKDQTAAGFTATGLVNGETESVLSGVIATVTAKDAGQYTNTATGLDKNYELSFVDGSLDIAKAKATVTANSVSTTYNGKDQTAAGFTATGLVNGETESVLSGVTATVTAKDAGKYTNSATGLDKNYELSFVDGSLDIAKAKATVTANSVSTTYNGKDLTAAGFTATGLVNGETESVLSGVTATVTAKDAGKYNNTVIGVDKNYDLTLIDGSLDIAKAKATVTANSLNTVYNGKDQTAAGFSAIGLVNGETESVLSGVSATVTAKDAGKYINTATGLDKNYELSFVDGSLDIAKAKATVTANSISTTYNGKDQTAAGFSATGLVNGETTTVLSGVSATVTGKDAGKYTNTVTGVDKNYDLTLIDGSLDIAKAKATVTANSVSTTYNGKDQTAVGFSATGLVNGETTTVLSDVSATVTGKDAGSYANTATGIDKNYELSFVNGSLDIAKAKATVTANSVSTTYNGKDQTAAGFSAIGLVNGETESVLSGVSATVTAKDAGKYINTATGLDKNYELSFVDGSLDIAKAKATVTANSISTTYNGKDQTAAGFTATGLVNGETESVLSGVNATVTAKDAGQYTNTATGLDKNYDLSFVDGALDIAKAKATVTANSVSTIYNGKDQTAAGFTATGLVNGETESVLSGVSATVTAKDAGKYNNTVTGVDKNYDLTLIDGSLDIAKAKATVTANSVSTTYNGKDQTAAGFSAIGLVNGETESVLSGVTATVTAKDAGKYTNTATGLDKNYELSFVDGSLDIAKAKATVTANSLNTVYNGKDQTAAGFTATGLVNGETDSVLSGVSATVTAKDAGQYTNKATGLDKNYELSFVDGSLDIGKAKATVTANSLNTVYNGKDQTAAGFTATGLVNGETESVLSGVSATVTAKDAGKYVNTATGLDKNYDLSFIDGSLDIAKAKAIVTANSVSTTYNGKDQTAAGFSATGLVNGETDSVLSGVTATVTAKDAGQYTNTAAGIDKNYELSFVDGSLDIAKAKAIVTANSVSTTYNGKDQTAAGFSATGLVNGETESVLSGVSATVTAKDAGQYTNTATGLDKNYDLSFVDGALDIVKAKATVTANSVSTIYNGKDQTAAGFTATGLVNGETESVLSGVSATVTAKDAGQYTNTATGLDKNYELSFVDGSLDIAKAKINQVTGITANNRIYDATTNASFNTGSAQFTGMVAGDELKVASATGQFSDKNVGIAKQVSIQGVSLSGADAHNYELVNNTAQTTADIRQANIQNIAGITANNRTYNGLTAAELNLSNAQFNGIYAGDNLNVATATGQFDSATTGQAKNVSITGLSLGGLDAQNYKLVDTTAVTTADIYLLTPAAYLQAIQFKRPRYLPETNNVLNTVDLDVRQGGVNTTGIQILAGEH